MPDEPQVIRQQMEQTRASLAEKLETLEQHVVQTVTGTTAAVSETVENVKEAVQETVDAVKGSVQDSVAAVKDTVQDSVASILARFDPSRHMHRHPWLFVTGAVVTGYCAGRMLENGSGTCSVRSARSYQPAAAPRYTETAAAETPQQRSGWLDMLTSQFSGEINRAKALAVGFAVGLARDLVAQRAPENLRERVAEIADSITSKLGGEVIEGPIWREERPV